MGVNLSEIIRRREIEIQSISGKTVAIDAHNTLYQFLSIIRDRYTGEPLKDSQGRITSHISGLFYRTSRMIENGIDPVFVFDGKPPDFKQITVDERRKIREEARKNLEEARLEKDIEKIRLYAQASSRLTKEMIDDSKKVLGLMGVPVVQAPSEGEAQAAYLANKGIVYASASQDWDSLLFGTRRMIKNLAITGRRKVPKKQDYVEVKPEIIEMDDVLRQLDINREQLVVMGILIGTDYNPGGVKGIGSKNALKLVRGKKPDSVLKGIRWEFEITPEKIFEFFMNPPVEDVDITRPQKRFGELKRFMLSRDFSEERVDSVIGRLEEKKDSGLNKWLK
jgi:flap endonuclease-1